MITPSKHLTPGRDLLSVGAVVIAVITEPTTVSELWERFQDKNRSMEQLLSFDWFTLALCFLFAVNALTLEHGVLARSST